MRKLFGYEQSNKPRHCFIYFTREQIDTLFFHAKDVVQGMIPLRESELHFKMELSEEQLSKIMYFLPENLTELRKYIQRAGDNIFNW